MNDQTIEKKIQAKGLTAPRITPGDIEANIAAEYYFTAGQATSGPSMEQVAHIAHDVNRAYCQALGDQSQLAWNDAPEWQRSSARMGVDLHTMGTFGPEGSHISWMAQKQAEGWKYGPVKDVEKKEHPCMVPFDQLPREQQAKDYLFRGVVHAVRDSMLEPNMRIAQLVIAPVIRAELVRAEELSDTERGEGGFGSTDK